MHCKNCVTLMWDFHDLILLKGTTIRIRHKSFCQKSRNSIEIKQRLVLYTLSHLKSFIESAIPPIRPFIMISMMPLKMCVAKENSLIALLRKDARNIF